MDQVRESTGEPKEIRARCRRRDRIRVCTKEYETDGGSNSGEYRRIQDKKDHIRARSEQVLEKGPGKYREKGRIQASIGEGSGQVSEKGPGEYRRRVRARTEKPKKKLAKHNNTMKEGVYPKIGHENATK
uniref:Uncharacterized protein n=1 Tax=Vitis vinifera TaxID=29760 RepID=A5BRQ9_VITVI|nr:hypothetical protein VITISV_028445 [Vitis vinifera]